MNEARILLGAGLVLILVLLGVFLFVPSQKQPSNLSVQTPASKETHTMQISSPAFSNNQPIPEKYTCQGENINPPLQFNDIPNKALSLALIVEDPDAPGRVFQHWLLYNINPVTTEIMENSVPSEATQGINDAGKASFTGPCPPSGTHRYIFHLFALDLSPEITANLKRDELDQKLNGHIIDQAELIGVYQKHG